MRTVQTVNGAITSDHLGAVLAHEHLIFGHPGWTADLSLDGFDRERLMQRLGKTFEVLGRHGVGTVVDATPADCGRDVRLLRDIAQQFGVHILCCTGLYTESLGGSAYFRNRSSLGFSMEKEITELFEHELYQGIQGTEIRAAAIKVACSAPEMTSYERTVYECAARIAARDRDIRILTHTSSGMYLKEQAELFLRHGVDPRQVCLGHACGNDDLVLQKSLSREGFYLGYDRFGQNAPDTPDDGQRLKQILKLAEWGCADRILQSTDRIFQSLGRKSSANREQMVRWYLNNRWEYIFEDILPMLRQQGLSDAQVDCLARGNPAAFYGAL